MQKQMSGILWGGLLGSSIGWICGLALSNINHENEFANASMVALGGQALGGIIGAFSEMEEE
jgi:hypothetical protein